MINKEDSDAIKRFHKVNFDLSDMKSTWNELKKSYIHLNTTARPDLRDGLILEKVMLASVFDDNNSKVSLMATLREDQLKSIHLADSIAACIICKVDNNMMNGLSGHLDDFEAALEIGCRDVWKANTMLEELKRADSKQQTKDYNRIQADWQAMNRALESEKSLKRAVRVFCYINRLSEGSGKPLDEINMVSRSFIVEISAGLTHHGIKSFRYR